MQTTRTCKKKKRSSNEWKYLKVPPKIFSAKLKTLDKAPWLGIAWNYIPKEAIKKSWETQMFEKRCSENLNKIPSEPYQTSRMMVFAKIVNGPKPLTNFTKSFI